MVEIKNAERNGDNELKKVFSEKLSKDDAQLIFLNQIYYQLDLFSRIDPSPRHKQIFLNNLEFVNKIMTAKEQELKYAEKDIKALLESPSVKAIRDIYSEIARSIR